MYNLDIEFEQKGLTTIQLKNIEPNQSILEVAMNNNIELHHNCGGVCACTTCHIYILEGDACLSDITDREEDYIDRAIRPTLQSRLACQAMLLKGQGDLKIKIPDQTQFLGE